jgi:hypothetical protein
MLAATAMAVVFAATAEAGLYKMVLCAGNNGSNHFDTATNTRSSQNPNGIFNVNNYCGPAPDPAGGNAFLRIEENQDGGPAGHTAYASASWTTIPWVDIVAGGGWTRQSGSFQDGWRARFWAEDWGGGTNNILMQGSGVANGSLGGIGWGTTSTFSPHLWPFGGWGKYRRFVYELTCMRPAGCDRSGHNVTDANTIVMILDDVSPPQVSLMNTDAPFLGGQWVRGTQTVYYKWSEIGSGIASERVLIDGAERWGIDHIAAAQCNRDISPSNGEFARVFQPCPALDNFGRHYTFDTNTLTDGPHTVGVCTQDYGQRQGYAGTGGQTCTQTTVRTDNTAPGAPGGLQVTSANPNRYLDRLGASFSLPANQGSPITRVHYQVTDAKGTVLKPTKTVTVANPTSLTGIDGPKAPGDYRLLVWLEDQVGFNGPAAEAPIPRDTIPPAAPQGLRVAAESSARWVERFDLRWHNVVDAGSPIDTARYQVLDGSGEVVVPTRTARGQDIEAIDGIDSPPRGRSYTVRLWLVDEEGNVGAPAQVPIPRDTTPPAAPQDISLTAPDRSRASEGFDLRWRNIVDEGSPIDAAHYQVLNAAGAVMVPTTTVVGRNVEAIADLDAPGSRGAHTLRLWLSDEEGNVGAPVRVPLAYDCVRSDVGGGTSLSAGLGTEQSAERIVEQGVGATLGGVLSGGGRGIANAPVCVFSNVLTDSGRDFLGVAMTDEEGRYRFALEAGPSRKVRVVYRPDQRQLSAEATLLSRVKPTLEVRRKVVHNKHYARFYGQIPGPHNDRVVVVLQVKQGKGWRAFRRYRTREGGRYRLVYRFGRTTRPATYLMRAQVRHQGGYPYLPGNSKALRLRVIP